MKLQPKQTQVIIEKILQQNKIPIFPSMILLLFARYN